MTFEELKGLLPKIGDPGKAFRVRELDQLGTLFLIPPTSNETETEWGRVDLVWHDNGEDETLYRYSFRKDGRTFTEQQRLHVRPLLATLTLGNTVPFDNSVPFDTTHLNGWDDDPLDLDHI